MINSSLAPEKIVTLFTKVNEKIALMSKYSTEDLLDLSTKLKEYQQRIDEFVTNHDNEENRKKLQGFHIKISQVIVDLQFNDIIRQKLEHLVEINNLVIEELSTNQEGVFSKIIVGVTELTREQLIYIDNEYSTATNNVKNQLMAVWEDKVLAGIIELGFLDILNNSDMFDKQVKMGTLELNKIIDAKVNDIAFDQNDYQLIESRYTMQSEREVFANLFGLAVDEEEEEIELF